MDLQPIFQAVVNGNAKGVSEGVQKAIEAGVAPGELMFNCLVPAMQEVGDRFEKHEFFVPEMLIAARAMQSGLKLIRPLMIQAGVEPIGKVALGTVKGDLHEIGKNLVGIMLEGAGFQVIDLGVDASADKFVQAVKDGAQVVAMSALLTTTMPAMRLTIDALKEAGLREQVKVMVGGAPVTQAYADQIGADGYAPDASGAARKAKEMLSI